MEIDLVDWRGVIGSVKGSSSIILSYNYDLRMFNKSIHLIQNQQSLAT
jgi:hypothetical protein